MNKYADDVEDLLGDFETASDIGVKFSESLPFELDFTRRSPGVHKVGNADFKVLRINKMFLHIDNFFSTGYDTGYLRSNIVMNIRTKSVSVLTTSNMTPYFAPTGYAIPKINENYGYYPLVTTNHLVPMNDGVQNVGVVGRRYKKVFTSKVYTNSLVIPIAAHPKIIGNYVDTSINVSSTDPAKSDKIGWQFVSTNYQRAVPQFPFYQEFRYSSSNRIMNFVAGSTAGEINAKDVRCTNLYVKPTSATGSATVQVNGSISCNSLIVGGSNITLEFNKITAAMMAAMSYLQASTSFKAFLMKSENSARLDFQVRAYLNLANQWAHLFVRRIRFNIVVATANMDVASEETTYLSGTGIDMIESLTSPGTFYRGDNAALTAPEYSNLYITISPTIYVNVNDAGIPHSFTNRATYNPTGTPIEVACPPLRVATPLSWSQIRL